jgi:hypothetical protein
VNRTVPIIIPFPNKNSGTAKIELINPDKFSEITKALNPI